MQLPSTPPPRHFLLYSPVLLVWPLETSGCAALDFALLGAGTSVYTLSPCTRCELADGSTVTEDQALLHVEPHLTIKLT